MRQTRKLVFAKQKVRELGIQIIGPWDQKELYRRLADAGYVWDADGVRWYKSPKGSTLPDSMFIDNEGLPSGVYRLRIRAHPDEIDAALREVVRPLEHLVVETSKVEMDDSGVSCRVYVTLKLSAAAKVKAAKQLRQKNEVQRG